MASEIKANKISPATGTDLTFGDSGDTFTLPSGATIVNSGTATGFGAVLQVKSVHVTTIASISISGHTWTDVGVSLAITPASTGSKIWVTGNLNMGHNGYGGMRLVRDSTPIGVNTEGSSGDRAVCHVGNQAGGEFANINFPVNWIDSPSTTSAVTYKYQFHYNTSGTIYLNREVTDSDHGNRTYAVSTLTLFELSAATIS